MCPGFSHQFFPTPLTSTPNSTSLPLLANGHSTVYPPSIQLPTFWKFNVAGYFSTIELIFQENNITTERSKYCLLIQSLSYTTDVLQKVANVTKTIDTLCHHPYTILKNALSQQYSSPTSPATCLQTLLHQCHRSKGSTVYEYYTKLNSLLSEHYDPALPLHRDLIKHKLLESLDPRIRLCLYHYEEGPLDILAQHADQLMSRDTPPNTPQLFENDSFDNLNAVGNQTLINEAVDSKIEHLQQQVSDLSNIHQTSSNTSPQSSFRRPLNNVHHSGTYPSTPTRFSRTSPATCYYHSRFGARAIKCEGPRCPSYTAINSASRPKNVTPVSMA